MKELSIEEKAKRYDEALKVANKYEDTHIMFPSIKDEIFPELKESEDERIKRILKAIVEKMAMHLHDVFTEEEFQCFDAWSYAWLEKPEEHSLSDVAKEVTKDKETAISFLKSCGIMDENGELAEEYRIKQGEQKHKSNIVPIFKEGDIIKNKKNGDTVKVEQILSDSYCYSGWDGAATIHSDFLISDQGNWELVKQKPAENRSKSSEESDVVVGESSEYKNGFECGKQYVLKYPEEFNLCKKPADKVEPKFKVGDWIITNKNHIWYVDETPETTSYLYRLTNQYGKVEVAEFEAVDKKAKLWTIQDAKDGDVLAAHECYVIFKEIDGLNIKCCCTYHYLGFNPSFYVDTLQNKDAFHPATKEQRDQLEKAMADAGYTFDFEKKELIDLVIH